MAYYSYKRVRSLIPIHIAARYSREWRDYHDSPEGKEKRIKYLISSGNSHEHAEEIWASDEFDWDNDYDGDLCDAAADYIEELLLK